jgi:hypothetical protein
MILGESATSQAEDTEPAASWDAAGKGAMLFRLGSFPSPEGTGTG